jgi:hypothetical protein
MPEALAVVLVFVVSCAIYVIAWFQSRDPSRFNPAEESTRLREHRSWVVERLARADREHWSEDMKEGLRADLAKTEKQIGEIQAKYPQARS